MDIRWIAIAATLPLAACAAMDAPTDNGPPPPAEMTCNADAVQSHIGHTASAAMGAAILTESGARTLRWVPPRTAVTMDFRPDRLTVSYDDGLKITAISCG